MAVLNMSKIQFKSNSQLQLAPSNINPSCAQYVKDTIQKQFTTLIHQCHANFRLCSICQRYNSKAIHNEAYQGQYKDDAVLNMSKIQFKSNSQLGDTLINTSTGCAQYVKDTIQKQFTTGTL